MHSKIVLEGADGVGKSTIAKVLADTLGYNLRGRIVRVGPENVCQAHGNDIRRVGNWIMDRCYWLSDYIYEPIYSGKPSVYDSTMICDMKDIHTVIIHVTCSDETLKQRFKARGDEIYNIDQILLAKFRYTEFFKRYREPFIEVDTTSMTTQECVNEIIKKLEEM